MESGICQFRVNTIYQNRTKYITNSMEQSPSSEANSHSDTKETQRFLWNPKVHYRLHNSLSLPYISSHMHPVHKLPPIFFKINYNIILLSMLLFHSRFPSKILYSFLISPMRDTCPVHLILLISSP